MRIKPGLLVSPNKLRKQITDKPANIKKFVLSQAFIEY
jgi:hypothetical protein